MGVVVFDPVRFRARYPEFADRTDDTLQEVFLEAGLYLNNTDGSIVADVAVRAMLLNIVVAHLLVLSARVSSMGGSAIVGRISSVTEGSVSVSASVGPETASNSWWMQTPYGASFWRLTAQYRTFQYVPGHSDVPVHPAARGMPWRR